MTPTLDQFMQNTSQKQKSGRMPKKSSRKNSPTLTSSRSDLLARLSLLRENGSRLQSLEARYFMKELGLQNKNDLASYSLKTLRESCRRDLPLARDSLKTMKKTQKEKLHRICTESKTDPQAAGQKLKSMFKKASASSVFSVRWMKSGTMRNGRCSTANILYRRTGPGYTLSDILETDPDPKYFLSEAAVQSLLAYAAKNAEAGHGFGPTVLPGLSVQTMEKKAGPKQ